MRHFFPANDDDNFTMRPQQLAYMRDVRERNLEGLYAGVRPKHHPKIVKLSASSPPATLIRTRSGQDLSTLRCVNKVAAQIHRMRRVAGHEEVSSACYPVRDLSGAMSKAKPAR